MKILKKTFIYILIYIGVIFSLLFFNYSQRDVSLRENEAFKITEVASIGSPLFPRKIRSLKIDFKGLTFLLSSKSPLLISTDDGVVRRSQVTGINITNDSVIVDKTNSVRIIFRSINYGESIAIDSTVPRVFPVIKEISIPISLEKGFKVENTDLAYKISSSNQEFFLKLNDNYLLDRKEMGLKVKVNNEKVPTLVFSQSGISNISLAEYWYMRVRNKNLPPIQKFIKDFVESCLVDINKQFSVIRYKRELG